MPDYVAKSITQSPEESITCGEGLERSYTKRFDVVLDLSESDSVYISPLQVYEGIVGLPQYGDNWTSRDGLRTDPLSVMRTWSGRREHSQRAQFSFNFNYTPRGRLDTPETANRNTGGGTDNINHLFPVWSFTTEDRMEARISGRDLNGKRMVNAAGDPFEPMPEVNNPIIVLNWSRYEPSFDGYTAEDLITNIDLYKYRTNIDTFLSSSANRGKWLIAEYSLSPELIGNRRVIRRDIVFKYDPNGWKDKLLNAGLYELIDTSTPTEEYDEGMGITLVYNMAYGNKRPIYSPQTGMPVTRPWPLQVNGAAITNPNSTDLNWIVFRNKYEVAFGGLNIVLQ